MAFKLSDFMNLPGIKLVYKMEKGEKIKEGEKNKGWLSNLKKEKRKQQNDKEKGAGRKERFPVVRKRNKATRN